MRTLWQHCHAATMAEGRYSLIEDAAIVTHAGLIEWIGPRAGLGPVEAERTVDLGGAWVTPGLIDCHTHAVFGGNRSGEFEQRLCLGRLGDARRAVEDEGRGDLRFLEHQFGLEQLELEPHRAEIFAEQEVHVLEGEPVMRMLGLRRGNDLAGGFSVLAGVRENA